MKRRSFFGLAVTLSLWPSLTRSEGDRTRRVAVLMNYPRNDLVGQTRYDSLVQSLRSLGWTEGQNLTIEVRWPGADLAHIQEDVDDLKKSSWDVIVATSTAITRALLTSGVTTPIVFTNVSDPVGDGFVQGLARPGNNVTGFINYEGPLAGKWLELLKEIDPRVQRASLLFNPDVAPRHGDYYWVPFEAAAKSFGIVPSAAPVRGDEDIDEAIRKIASEPGGGLVVASDSFVGVHRATIVASAARQRVPASYPFAVEGALVSYGPRLALFFDALGPYVDKILKGAKAAELPVQVPTKLDLVINLRTAKGLGLQVPVTLLSRADEVIE